MSLSPYTSVLASGVRIDSTTETYDVATRGRKGVLVAHNLTECYKGYSYVQGAAIAVAGTLVSPLVVGTNSQSTFKYNSNEYTIANGTYSTLSALATAVGAALYSATAFSTVVTVTASADGTALVFTSVASGVNTDAFAVGTHDALVLLGLTDTWTIAHTEAAGADGAASTTVYICGKDEASGLFYQLLAGAAVTTNVLNEYSVHPEVPASTNVAAQNFLPANIRVVVTHTTNNCINRTLGIQLVS